MHITYSISYYSHKYMHAVMTVDYAQQEDYINNIVSSWVSRTLDIRKLFILLTDVHFNAKYSALN